MTTNEEEQGWEEEQEEDETINNPEVLARYKAAGEICDKALAAVIAAVAPDKTAVDLAEIGDKTILELTAANDIKPSGEDEKIEKGIAFPTCININNVASHYAPLKGDKAYVKVGDVVKIDLGCHIDGYVAVQAHTMMVQPSETPIKGKYANVLSAAQMCLDVAIKSLRPTATNGNISSLWEKIAEAHGVNMCDGILSHQMKRFVIDGNECIIGKGSAENRVDDVTFDKHQVWAIDVVMSSGVGKLKEGDSRPFVFKRNAEQSYNLKLKTGRDVIREIQQKFQTFPFTARHLTTRGSLLGIKDAGSHDLLATYPVLYAREREVLVHLKATVLITDTSIVRLTGCQNKLDVVETEAKCDDKAVTEALALSLDF